jgi:hypothetical protein
VMAPGDGWLAGDSAIGINGERGSVPTQMDL